MPIGLIKNLFVAIYALTIGRIIGRIKEKILVKRIGRLLASGAFDKGDEKSDVAKADTGYKREGRISFGGKHNAG